MLKTLLQVRSGKCKSIFQAYEKLFFPIYFANQQWVLVEVRTNPKMIVVYDPINKSILRNKYADSLFSIFQELIRWDYKDKSLQNPDFVNLWEKKILFYPSLVVKNINDTGVLLIKIISNAFQHKDFTNLNISLKEICIIRKKIEKFFKYRDDNHAGEKFVPF